MSAMLGKPCKETYGLLSLSKSFAMVVLCEIIVIVVSLAIVQFSIVKEDIWPIFDRTSVAWLVISRMAERANIQGLKNGAATIAVPG